jgi:hypothetical protein
MVVDNIDRPSECGAVPGTLQQLVELSWANHAGMLSEHGGAGRQTAW